MSLTRDHYALRDDAAKESLRRLDRIIESCDLAQYRTLLKRFKDNLFEVDFRVEHLLEETEMTSPDAREKLEQMLGCPPATFRRDCQCETAERLLGNTRLSVESIGELVGFSMKQTFARSFKSWAGAGPEAHRQRLRRHPGAVSTSGVRFTSVEMALQAQRNELSVAEARELFRRVWGFLIAHCATLDGDEALEPERRLADELREKRLGQDPDERLVELCRRFFTTSALDDLLGEPRRRGK